MLNVSIFSIFKRYICSIPNINVSISSRRPALAIGCASNRWQSIFVQSINYLLIVREIAVTYKHAALRLSGRGKRTCRIVASVEK